MFLSDESWKLIIYRDLKPLFIAKESLIRLSNKFESIFIRNTTFHNVRSIKSFLKINLDKIENRLSELNMYLGKNSRQKRELLDGLSPILKWLIGTPDARDARRYDDCINQLEKRETDLSSLMLEQVQITSSTIKNFNETIFKITYDEQIINENINRLNNYLNTTQKIIFDLKVSEEITTISLQILESVINLENEINDCLASILFAKSNTIHPSIINLKRLYEELLLSNHIRTTKHLIASVTLENIHTILDSASLLAYVYSDRLMYILDFPLIQNEPFNLYHIYSIPIQYPNSSFHTTILPEHTYLATNLNGQSYISTSNLDSCKTYASNSKICKNLVAYDSKQRPICELQILHSVSRSLPELCSTSVFQATINTFQNIDNSKWLYILTEETNCILQCKNEVSHHKLQGAGILSLPSGCKFHTGYSTLTAHEVSETNISHPIIIPDIRNDDCFEELKGLDIPSLIPIKINEVPLDSLNQIKHQTDKYKEEIKKFKSQTFISKNYSTFSWIYLTLAMSMLGFLIYKICKRCPNGFLLRRRNSSNDQGCIQIFNNCFATSSRHQRTRVAIPMTSISTNTCISEDEEETESSHSQRSVLNTQSLF